jgi:hypothetical protein
MIETETQHAETERTETESGHDVTKKVIPHLQMINRLF